MIKCPACGEENPAKFRLCGYCGTPLVQAAAPLPPQEVRKTVTLIFVDLKDSTSLGERLDSEAMHEVKERYFGAMAAEIQRHGGKIEKYIGDAIMAVFGLPRAHEDDALRAVRAAAGMRQVLTSLNEDLKKRYGVELANRTGVNTGEVVASDDPTRDQKLATGDAVNVTARLEAAAPPNEIYIGEVTYRLVRDAVKAEAVAPLTLKGKAEPVPAFRLVSVYGEDGNVRRHDTPVVGREAELASLEEAWQEVNTERRARLVTVIGDAGVGKTRLVREIMERLSARARVISGRCLPYGEGITFWPLRGMVIGAAGIHEKDSPEEARARILECVRDQDIADRLASASGLSSTSFPLHEINWGARKFFEALAAESPVVALFDDIHWAEPAFLDLMENLLDTIENAPVLMLATARHELFESKPEWSERAGARRLVLQPLGDAAVAQVITNLLGSAGLPEAFIGRVVAAAEGNPLYVEQMLSMLVDSGVVKQENGQWVAAKTGGEISIPPTIHALLEARLDKLERGERAAAEPASVIGLEFARPAVQSLCPASLREGIDEKLQALSRKHFIRPSISTDGDTRYRFDHHLVRDTVYNGLLKRARATMHAEFVKWADQVNADSDRGQEFEEILGYHLEQAYKYLGELGPIDDAGAAIGRDGARRLANAGRRALGRGDMHAAASLLQRACSLLPADDLQRAELLPDLGETLVGVGQFDAARKALQEAQSVADRLSKPRIRGAGRLMEMFLQLYSGDSSVAGDAILSSTKDLIQLFEAEKAHNELATAWRLIILVHGMAGRYREAAEAAERSMEHARIAGNDRLIAKIGGIFAINALYAPTPVERGIEQCERLLADGFSDRVVECNVMCVLAQLRAMNGQIDAARGLYRQGRAVLRDLGEGVYAASTGIELARVELHGGDLAAAEKEVREDFKFLAGKGETYFLSTMAALLARLVRDQGRDDEALALLFTAEQATSEDDLESQALWRAIRAPILGRKGDFEQAEVLGRTAVDLTSRTENLNLRADSLVELASVLHDAGKHDEARALVSDALEMYSLKGDIVSAEVARSLLQKIASG